MPTVERGFFDVVFCSMAIAGDRPSIWSTSGFCIISQELARVGRERLDVAPLALGVDRVEGERGLARAGEAGEHDQLVARDGQVDVLEVVLARAADHDRPAAEQRFDGLSVDGLGRVLGRAISAPL